MPLNQDLHYYDHPRYALRRFMILSSIAGIISSCSIISTYGIPSNISSAFTYVFFWLVGSTVVSLWDLIDWIVRQAIISHRRSRLAAERRPLLTPVLDDIPHETTNDDDDNDGDDDDNSPKDQPRAIIVVFDIVLFVALVMLWLGILDEIPRGYGWRYDGYSYTMVQNVMICSYASFTIVLCALGHMFCFWKELMAIKKGNWQRTLGRRRWTWEDQLNKFVAAAQNVSANLQERNIYNTPGCNCACASVEHREQIAQLIRQENTIIERFMRYLGKLPHPRGGRGEYEDIDDVVDATTSNHDGEDVVDVEAGPSHSRNTFAFTPSSSASNADDQKPKNIMVESGMNSNLDQAQQQSITSDKTLSDSVEVVVVKKKGKASRRGKSRDSKAE